MLSKQLQHRHAAQATTHAARAPRLRRRAPFGMVAVHVIRDLSLSAAARMLYVNLACYADSSREAFPTNTRLAADLGWHPATVKRAKAELVDAGVLEVEAQFRPNGSQRESIYWLNDQDPAPAAAVPDAPTAAASEGGVEIPTGGGVERPAACGQLRGGGAWVRRGGARGCAPRGWRGCAPYEQRPREQRAPRRRVSAWQGERRATARRRDLTRWLSRVRGCERALRAPLTSLRRVPPARRPRRVVCVVDG